MKAEGIVQEFNRGGALRQSLLDYAGEYITQVSQRAACNTLHNVEKRFAVWLLMLSDRLGEDEVELTQERMAQHLGVRRSGISVIAKELQDRGAISYTRGCLRILNRQALESAACECYKAISIASEQLTCR